MNKEERIECYKKAIDKWGMTSQYDQLIEEMAELTLALCKLKRAENNIAQKKQGVIENVIEEMADVKMCLEEMEYVLGEEKVDTMLETKMKKFIGQLNE